MGARVRLTTGALVLALGACSGAPSNAPTQPFTTPSAVTTTPNGGTSATSARSGQPSATPPTAETIPASARGHTSAAAEAFARYYLARVNEAWMAANEELLLKLSDEDCKTCANFAATAQALRTDSHQYAAKPLGLGPSILLPESTKNHVFIQFVFTQFPATIVTSVGATYKQVPERKALSEFELRWVVDHWTVHEIKVVRA